MSRLVVLAVRLRAGIVWALPILAVATLVALLLTLALVASSAAAQRDDVEAQRDDQAETLRHVEALAIEAKNASETNRQILEQIRPCVIGDPADSPACVAQARRDQVVADAIAQIQHQHDEVLSRLSSLLSRPVAQRTTVVREAAPVSPGVRAAPGGTNTAPGAPAATQSAPEPSPTTTACDQRGKSGRCK